IEVSLGARLADDFGPPIEVRAKVVKLTDGRIINTGPFCNGLMFEYGDTAMLEVKGIRIILVSRCLTVTDPAFFALHDVDVPSLGILAVKAKNQFRAAFTSVFNTMIDVDVPGPAAYDFAKLGFT